VLGGSETAGIGCDDGVVLTKACAWSARFAYWLQSEFPKAHIVLDNQASGGYTSSAAIPLIGTWLASKPSLILTDFIINDSFETQEDTSLPLPVVVEAFLRQIYEVDFEANVVFVSNCPYDECRRPLFTYQDVARAYDVPHVGLLPLVDCAQKRNPPQNMGDAWVAVNGPFHPSFKTHQLISNYLAFTSTSRWGTCTLSNTQPVADRESLDKIATCATPTSMFDAHLPFNSSRVAAVGGWELREERGKPGWIIETPEGLSSNSLTFTITFGASPRLMVTWLRSYERLGDAELTINGKTLTLPGLYRKRTGTEECIGCDASALNVNTSQAYLLTLQVQKNIWQPEQGLNGLLGAGVASFSTHAVTLRGRSGKFKLLSIASC
jgi:hypothetical protein